MAAPVAYNLAPLAQLLGVGAILALGPLLWLAWHHRGAGAQRRLHALTVLTLFLTFDLVLFGAFTRLTDSGLGCPDWPGCYGHASPLGAVQHIEQAQQTLVIALLVAVGFVLPGVIAAGMDPQHRT